MTSFSDILSVDPLGFVCIPADMLDAAFARADKPTLVPRTCADGLAKPTPTILAAQLGHEPTRDEWVSSWVHWSQATGASLSAPPPYQIETAATPLPGSAILMASAMAAVVAVAWLRGRIGRRASGEHVESRYSPKSGSRVIALPGKQVGALRCHPWALRATGEIEGSGGQ